MSERKVAPHVARAIGALQAKPAPASRLPAAPPTRLPAPASHSASQPPSHLRQAVAAVQAMPSPAPQRAASHLERAVATARGGAPLQAKPAPAPPLRAPAPPPPPPPHRAPRAIQRMDSDDGEWRGDSDEEREAKYEEDQHERLLDIKENKKKWARVGKPKGLVNHFFDNHNFAPSSPVREDDLFDERVNPNKVKPKGKSAKPVYKIPCNRCGLPIRLSASHHELAVGFDKGQRKRPPMGHILDFSIYRFALELHIENNVPKKYQAEYRKIATWDRQNLGLEHFDCNARAKKVTQRNITSDQEDKGNKLVLKCHARWLKEAMEEVDGV